MGMEGSLPLAPSLPQPTWAVFKGLVKVKKLIPMDFKLFFNFLGRDSSLLGFVKYEWSQE